MLFECASVKNGAIKAFFSLFPAYAGVIPHFVTFSIDNITFPRVCGGDP